MENSIEQFEDILREDIAKLESNRDSLQKKVEKLTQTFNARDIQKIDKLASEINSIDHTIIHLYALIGSFRNRMKIE